MTRRRFGWRVHLVVLGALLGSMLLPSSLTGVAQAQVPGSGEGLRVVLETTDTGYGCVKGCDAVVFEGSPWEVGIQASVGQLVELTFVWAHEGYIEEEHIMVLEGYGLESDKIDFHNRETTLSLIADKPGSFLLKCDLECELHDYMQRGYLRVTRAGGTGGDGDAMGTSYTPTNLGLQTSTPLLTGFEIVTLRAILTDSQGAPVSRAVISFYKNASFGPAEGAMLFARGRTDAEGVVRVEYRPTLPAGEHAIVARFDGLGVYDESEQNITLQVIGDPHPAYRPDPIGLESVRNAAPAALVLIMASVWIALGFVLLKVLARPRSKPST